MKKKYSSPVLLLDEMDDLQGVGLGVDEEDPEENVPASAAGTGHDEP